MLIIHPSFTSEYAKCKSCELIHVVIRVNENPINTCNKCGKQDFCIIDTSIVPVIPDSKMARVEIKRI